MSARKQKLIVPNPRVLVVHSLTELANAKFGPANLIKLPRQLKGDFNGLARKLGAFLFALPEEPIDRDYMITGPNMAHVSRKGMMELGAQGLKLTLSEQYAVYEILADMEFSDRESGGEHSNLRVIGYKGYIPSARKTHTDGYPEMVDSILETRKTNPDFMSDYDMGGVGCCYNVPVTQNLLNEDAEHVDGFVFRTKKGRRFREDIAVGDLFRHAAFSLDGSYLPFVHRVPPEIKPEDPPRLLLR